MPIARPHRIKISSLAAFAASAFFFTAAAHAQFPDLPGKDVTVRVCGMCHEAERAAALHQDRDGWDATLSAMAGRGMAVSDDDYTAMLNYLSKAFPGEAPKPVNINTASAIDLESTFSMLRSQAALLVAWRDKNGKFKTFDDLKKVPGLDISKLESKKERIAFQ